MTTYLISPDSHAHYEHNNDRADWMGQLMVDLKPDVFMHLGDHADLPSLSSYDKGKRSFHGKSYKKDIDSSLEYQERLWGQAKRSKKKLPHSVILEGNHENRIERVLDLSPELAGTVDFKDLRFHEYYDEVIRYDGGLPGIYERDGILFAHFFPTGISGRPLGGERPAHMLLAKNSKSSICGHSHTLDYATRRTVSGQTLNAVVAGCYQDYINDWCGPIGRFWQSGVVILRNVQDGEFDFQWVSLSSLKRMYGE